MYVTSHICNTNTVYSKVGLSTDDLMVRRYMCTPSTPSYTTHKNTASKFDFCVHILNLKFLPVAHLASGLPLPLSDIFPSLLLPSASASHCFLAPPLYI